MNRHTPIFSFYILTLLGLGLMVVSPTVHAQSDQQLSISEYRHVIKTPTLGFVNPVYPEVQLAYGLIKKGKWSIHAATGWVNGLNYYLSAPDQFKNRNGFRGSLGFRLDLNGESKSRIDFSLGPRLMVSNIWRTEINFYRPPGASFSKLERISGNTQAQSLILEAVWRSDNPNKRSAFEVSLGLGPKRIQRTFSGPDYINPRRLYSTLENLIAHNRVVWTSNVSFALAYVFKFGQLYSRD